MRPVLLTAVVLGGAAAGSLFSPANSQPPDRLPDFPPAPGAAAPGIAPTENPHALYGVGKAPFAHRPATSCASASCHGAGETGKVGSEYSTWAPEAFPEGPTDPHAKAYSVLFNSLSVQMGKILKTTPHKDARCLACHAIESGKDPEIREQILAEGVGCGGCHGPADKWIGQHYTAEWKALSNQEKWEKYGFVPTKNLVARTVNCASCHVGDVGRDMNHDFIAAGHPRLAFEAARFHHQPDYRKHWTEKGTPRDFEVRLWVIGQAATLRAAVNLLHDRAKRAEANDPNTPWPEFSGHSCYACHKTIPDTNVRGAASETTRRAGIPGWEVWSNAAAGVAADSCSLAFPGLSSSRLSNVKLPAVEKLRNELGKSMALPPAKVKGLAENALRELDAWLAALQAAEDQQSPGVANDTPRVIAHRLTRNALSKDGTALADTDWDALAANYLGTAAMYYAAGQDEEKAWREPLLKLRDSLRFPPTAEGRFNNPADLDRKKLNLIRNNFELLRNATATPGEK